MTQLLHLPPQRPRKRWTKQEYNRCVENGLRFRGRVYLHRGELVEEPPVGTLRARGLTTLNGWLFESLHQEFAVRIRSPFETPGESMPEPDFAVVTKKQMSRFPHPDRALLVISVSECSVELDQEMAFDYAAALVPDYWIVNMRDRLIEVYHDPIADASAPLGYRYARHQIFREGQSVSPLAKPEVSIAVSTLVTVE